MKYGKKREPIVQIKEKIKVKVYTYFTEENYYKLIIVVPFIQNESILKVVPLPLSTILNLVRHPQWASTVRTSPVF